MIFILFIIGWFLCYSGFIFFFTKGMRNEDCDFSDIFEDYLPILFLGIFLAPFFFVGTGIIYYLNKR